MCKGFYITCTEMSSMCHGFAYAEEYDRWNSWESSDEYLELQILRRAETCRMFWWWFFCFFHMSYLLSCFLLGSATFADCTSGFLNPNYLKQKQKCRVSRPSQNMRVSPTISLLNSIFFRGTCIKDKHDPIFPISGLYFSLLENDQKRIFYVISWVYGLLGGACKVLWGSQPKFCTWPSSFTWILCCKANIAI